MMCLSVERLLVVCCVVFGVGVFVRCLISGLSVWMYGLCFVILVISLFWFVVCLIDMCCDGNVVSSDSFSCLVICVGSSLSLVLN